MATFLKKHQTLAASALLCLLSLYLASTPTRGAGGEIIVRRVLAVFTTPIQNAIIGVRSGIKSTWLNYVMLLGVRHENYALKDKVASLEGENTRLKEELSLANRLKDLADFKESRHIKGVIAGILNYSGYALSGGWTRVVIINKGSLDGIKEDMPVISPLGVVGRVIETDKYSAKVLLLIDPRSNIAATLQRTRLRGIIEGSGNDLVLKYIREVDDVNIGDSVVTAGIAGIFPKGLLIGKVVDIKEGEDNFYKYIEVAPAVDFTSLEEALVITEKKDSYDIYKGEKSTETPKE